MARADEVAAFFTPMAMSPEVLEVLAPRAKRHMLDWMEEDFILPAMSSRVKGPWSRSITPFWVTVINWLCDGTTRVIWVYAATQVGKSTIMSGWMGYVIDVDPGPMKMVMPDKKVVRKRIKRLRAVFGNSPRILRHIAGGDIENLLVGEPTVFDNMMLTLGWPTSPDTLADDPTRYIGGDEVCEWEEDIKDDTDPLTKLSNRVRTYQNISKQFYCTSPKNKNDLADQNFDACQKWSIWIPCPHCDEFHLADFRHVRLDKDADDWYFPAADYKKGGMAHYVCPACGAFWTELERKAAVSSYRACPEGCTIGEDGGIIGEYDDAENKALTVPAVLVDPMFTTVDMLAGDYANAMHHQRAGNINPYRNFRNNQEAQPWEDKQRQTPMSQLRRHISSYPVRMVPEWAQMICCGIDVQADHIWAAVKAYGYRNQQALIWAGRKETGHTGRLDNWKIVEDFILSEWISVADESVKFRAAKTAIDCRYQRVERDEESTVVYDFCLRFSEGYVIPVMGYGRKRMRYQSYRRQAVAGKALMRFDVNVDGGKDKLWQALYDKDRQPGPGYLHLWSGIGDDILRHLASEEQIVKRIKGGRDLVVWQKKKGVRRNDIWDCNVYADFAAELAGVFHLRDVDVIAHVQASRAAAAKSDTSDQSGLMSGLPKLRIT